MNENLVATWDTAEVETPTVSFECPFHGSVVIINQRIEKVKSF